jgi:proteasome lid subunit RPN8/RPN11
MKKGAFPAMNKMKKMKKTSITTPQLRFTPTAWAKLLYLRDLGETEVGGFGVCPNELLLVEDIRLVSQTCSYTTVSFADDAVANYFDEQVEQGLRPEQFARVWIHTHPGASSHPSQIDEETFSRVFGQSNWAVMFILACGGSTYARLRFNQGPTAELLLSTEVDFQQPFGRSAFETWEQEYLENVSQIDPFQSVSRNLFDPAGYLELPESESFDDIYLKMWQEHQHQDEFDHDYF